MLFRKDAAALAVAAATAVGLLTVPAGASVGANADTTVALQVVPRGNGSVSTSVPDRTTGSTTCTQNQEPNACSWTFAKGAAVVLSAKPGAGATFAGWSTPDCPGTSDCKLTLDDDQSVVALFSKLTLSIDTTGARTGDLVTSSPAGISCPDKCSADFDAKSTVRLTVTTGSGSTLTSFPYGCASVDGATCTVTMLDDPQFVGVKFNNAAGPTQPDVVNVTVTVGKTGDGTGRVTAAGLDCGNVCFASFPYGTLARFSAAPDTGSLFGGWGGLCASDSAPRCSLPIGPITLVRPKFVKAGPPSAPASLTAASTSSSITLSWGASQADLGLKDYEVFLGSEPSPRVSTSATSATLDGLACGTTFTVSVEAVDTAGTPSSRASLQVATSACPLGVQLVGSSLSRGRLVLRLKAASAAKGTATLFLNGKQVARRVVSLRAGADALSFKLPRSSGGRHARLVLRFGPKTLVYRIVVPG